MLSLPRQGYPVTCRIGHCRACSPLALLFASDILCDSPTVNRAKPCHKKCGSANLRVCKSAGLQVCKSAVCVCRTPRQIRLQMCDTSAVKWDTEWHYLGLSTEYRANFLGIYLYFRNSDLISIGSLTHSLTLDFIYGLNNHGCDMPDVVKISLWGKLMFN